MNNQVMKCGGCNHIFTETCNYSYHQCTGKLMKEVTKTLTDLVGEPFIAEDILNIKYAMEHKDKMEKICKSFEDMVCIILNPIDKTNYKGETIDLIHTHLTFHDKIEELDFSHFEGTSIEYYNFAYMESEEKIHTYIINTMRMKKEIYLNKKEYHEVWHNF